MLATPRSCKILNRRNLRAKYCGITTYLRRKHCCCGVFVWADLSSSKFQTVPAGMRHAQQLEQQNERGFPPPDPSRRSVSIAELNTEADQLAQLAASVPKSVQNAGKGLLEKRSAGEVEADREA